MNLRVELLVKGLRAIRDEVSLLLAYHLARTLILPPPRGLASEGFAAGHSVATIRLCAVRLLGECPDPGRCDPTA
eukprot:scaffold947_cov375-Prasinococcus_capsulatus_cf.AAC.17